MDEENQIEIAQRRQCPKCENWIAMIVSFTREQWISLLERLIEDA